MYRKYQLVIFLFFSEWSFCYACYSSRVSSHMSNSVVSQGVLTSGISGVGELYSCSTKTIVLSSVVVTEVASGSSCRAHTDFTWTPSKKDGMHTQKEGQCQVCWKLLIWRKAWCEMGSSVIKTLSFNDCFNSVVVPLNSQIQNRAYLKNHTGNSCIFLYLLCRIIILLCNSLQTVLETVVSRIW